MSKILNKYNSAFGDDDDDDDDDDDETLLVLSAASGSVYIASVETVIGAPVRRTIKILVLVFSISNGIAKKLKNNKKK